MKARRAALDALDDAILALMAQRAVAVAEAWAEKRARGAPLYDPQREAEVIARVRGRAVEFGLDPDAVEATFRTLLGQAGAR